MEKINKLIILLFLILNIGGNSLADDDFFEKGKNKYDERNIKNLNFYFKEALFSIRRIKIHTYI